MMTTGTSAEVYQLHVWIRHISPMIWRRLFVRSDSTIADLHFTLQITFGWSDDHLNRFGAENFQLMGAAHKVAFTTTEPFMGNIVALPCPLDRE